MLVHLLGQGLPSKSFRGGPHAWVPVYAVEEAVEGYAVSHLLEPPCNCLEGPVFLAAPSRSRTHVTSAGSAARNRHGAVSQPAGVRGTAPTPQQERHNPPTLVPDKPAQDHSLHDTSPVRWCLGVDWTGGSKSDEARP